ncbi:MAG: hypothetical protein IT204_11460 [Fimbriimonadaceae bacterium]|nr:hypothetical protein [Fimbriimonadaceae bacterium]
MAAIIRPARRSFELLLDDEVRLLIDDLTLTAWGERHRLAAGGLRPGPPAETLSHDELGPHNVHTFPFTTRSVRQSVEFRLSLRCYELEPVVLAELLPGCGQPVLGQEEAASLRIGALPGCREALYLHQRVNEFGRDAVGCWWAQALWLADPTRDNLWDWGLACHWRCDDGRCGTLLPLRAGGAVARLRGEELGLSVVASGWCTRHVYPRLPLFVLAFDDTPAASLDRAVRAAEGLCEWSFRRREEKTYPLALDGLGWATWQGLGRDLDEERVVSAARELREAGVPLQWVLLEEGWQELNAAGQLRGFDAAPERFPGGLFGLLQRLAGEAGVRHLATWLPLQGAWGGIDPHSALATPADSIWPAADGVHLPEPGGAGTDFWRPALRHLRDCGVDWVRIDNQGSTRNHYLGRLPLDQAVGGALRNVQQAALEVGLELGAGMGVQTECLLHWNQLNVARSTADLAPGDRRAAKQHLAWSATVGAWLGRYAWPDHDAVPSTHLAARALAVLAALSGGPLYLGDAPGAHDLELIRRLSLRDGRLLQPEQPGEPPAALWFVDPLHGTQPLVVCAPAGRLPRREPPVGLNEPRPLPEALLVGLVNVRLDGQPATSELHLSDLPLPPADCYAVTRHFAEESWIATVDDALDVTLDELEAELVTITPLRDGRAVLGRRDLLLGACGCHWDADDCVSLPEPGLILLCDEVGLQPTQIDGTPYRPVEMARPLGPGECWREGPWVLVHATSTLFQMLPPSAPPAGT